MALSPERIQELRQKAGIPAGGVAPGGSVGTPTLDANGRIEQLRKNATLRTEAAAADETATKANTKLGIAKETAKQIPQKIASSVIGTGKRLGEAAAASDVQKDVIAADTGLKDMAIRVLRQISENKKNGKDITRLQKAYNEIAGDTQTGDMGEILPSLNDSNFDAIFDSLGVGLDVVTAGTAAPVKGAVKEVAKESAEMAGKALKPVAEKLATRSERKVTEKLTDAMTPLLTPMRKLKGIVADAKGGEVFDAAMDEKVTRSVAALQDVAKELGKKPTAFIKTGVKKAQDNAAGLGNAIKEYAEKKVTPFLQESGVNYNFTDLRKSLELVQPSEALDGAAKAAYNKVRSRVIAAIANKVGPETKGIKSVAEMRKKAGETGEIAKKVLKGDIDFWDARKIIDSIVDEETKGKAFGDAALAGAKAAYKDMRQGFAQYLAEAFRYPGQMDKVNKANEFLKSERVVKMDKAGWNIDQFEEQFGLVRSQADEAMAAQWEKYMDNMSSLYDGIANVGTKAAKEYGKNKAALWMKEHPAMAEMLKQAAWWGFGGAAAAVGAKAVGGF